MVDNLMHFPTCRFPSPDSGPLRRSRTLPHARLYHHVAVRHNATVVPFAILLIKISQHLNILQSDLVRESEIMGDGKELRNAASPFMPEWEIIPTLRPYFKHLCANIVR